METRWERLVTGIRPRLDRAGDAQWEHEIRSSRKMAAGQTSVDIFLDIRPYAQMRVERMMGQ